MQVNRRRAVLGNSKGNRSILEWGLSLRFGLPLLLLGACGGDPGSATVDAEAGVREVVEWHDPDYKTTKLAEGKTRYGKEIGEWVWFYPGQEVHRRGSFVDGIKSGEWLEYHQNGEVATSETYIDGKLQGVKSTFYDDGKPKESVNFERGLKVGESEAFFPNGERYTKTVFVADHAQGRDYPQGRFETYHDNGQLGSEVEYVNGLKSGPEIEYHYDGSKGKEVFYENGKLTGATRGWFANGSLQLEGQFEDGKQEGVWKQYHPNGQLALEGTWKAGVQVGLWKAFHDDGSPQFLGQYAYSTSVKKPGAQPHGLVQEWNADGSRKAYGFLKLGNQFGTFYRWDEAGALLPEVSGHFRGAQRVRGLSEDEIADGAQLAADRAPHDPSTPLPELPNLPPQGE